MTFWIHRIGQAILILWGIVSLLFLIFYALGDPVSYLVDDKADADTKRAIMARYGLDQPLYVQYGRYLNQLSPVGMMDSSLQAEVPHWVWVEGETSFGVKWPYLGRSYRSRLPVAEMIAGRLGGTVILALAAMLLAAGLGLPLGVIAALRYGKPTDQAILSVSVLGVSAPSFFVGVLVAYWFAILGRSWTGLTLSGFIWEDAIFEPGQRLVLKNLLLPALALGVRPLAIFVQLTRSSLLDVLTLDYVRTAHAKGLSPRRVLLHHSLRNALNPVLTSITGWLASLLAGAFFIEYIFNWQGLGKLIIDALLQNDIPVIIGGAMTVGLIFVSISLLTDVLYAWLDPRVKLG
jgi:peptide/nickel transport system permease protein